MSPVSPRTLAGAALAATMRSLAKQAHLLLNEPTTEDHELRDLVRRIASAQRELACWPPSNLSRWLENLRVQVDSRTERSLCVARR
jgi:hypothetical protein